jgi:hypothetical protein
MAGEIVAIKYDQDGQYLLTIQSGQVQVVPIVALVDVTRPGPEPPNPPTPPSVLTDRAKAIRDAARLVQDANRSEVAQKLAAVYGGLADEVRSGKIQTPDALLFGVRTGADLLLTSQSQRQAWQPVRDLLSNQWSAVAQEGGAIGDYAQLLDETAAGLKASVPANAEAIDLRTILEIIKIILDLIERLNP